MNVNACQKNDERPSILKGMIHSGKKNKEGEKKRKEEEEKKISDPLINDI